MVLATGILGYHIASRLAYVIGVGLALRRQERHQVFTRNGGVEAGFRRFRRIAATLMNNDALSLGTYSIPAGGTDDQKPHTEDEVYVVQAGRATLVTTSGTVPVEPGRLPGASRGGAS